MTASHTIIKIDTMYADSKNVSRKQSDITCDSPSHVKWDCSTILLKFDKFSLWLMQIFFYKKKRVKRENIIERIVR